MAHPEHHHLLQKYPAQLPRYTSYPTAPHFEPMQGNVYAEWLARVAAHTTASLYLHIPYCRKLCWFCGCHTKITQRYDTVSHYLGALQQEMLLVRQGLGRKQPVSHVHFGGGSPTMLACHDFLSVMESMRECFSVADNAQIAVEIDPRTVTEAKVASYARSGVNRVSIGVQDFDPSVQKAINRIQPFAVVYDAIRLCREYGIHHISLDLVYGLPLQSAEGFLKTLEHAMILAPDRIALFGYAHVPWKKPHMKLIREETLPGAEARLRLAEMAADTLRNAGYVPVGLDHFARPEDSMAVAMASHSLKRNFQGYTTDPGEILIGLGASAIGSLAEGYAQNMSDIEAYKQSIAQGIVPVARGKLLSDDDRRRREIIESLMCYYEADVSWIDLKQPGICEVLKDLLQDGLIQLSENKLLVDKNIPQAVRLACAAFDAYLDTSFTQHGQVA